MNEILAIVLAVCVALLTITLILVGINIFRILSEVKKSLSKANEAIDKANLVIDTTQSKIEGILNPFHSLGAFITNFTAGLKVAGGFMDWLNKDQVVEDEDLEEDLPIKKARKKKA